MSLAGIAVQKAHFMVLPNANRLKGIERREWMDILLVWNFIMIVFDAEAWLGRSRARHYGTKVDVGDVKSRRNCLHGVFFSHD